MIKLLLFTLLIAGKLCFAQKVGRMETDRPDQTESPEIVRKGWMQTEIGFNIEKDNKLTTLVHPTILWKYGLSKRFEFRYSAIGFSFRFDTRKKK